MPTGTHTTAALAEPAAGLPHVPARVGGGPDAPRQHPAVIGTPCPLHWRMCRLILESSATA